MRVMRKEQPTMTSELEPHIESQDMGTDANDGLRQVHPDGQPTTYEGDPIRAEAMAYAENRHRVASKEFVALALRAADNIEAGNNQSVSRKHEYDWDPPFSDFTTEWEGVAGNYDESDKIALATIARRHPNRKKLPSDHPMGEESWHSEGNSRIQLSHEEIADAAIEHAQEAIELASREAERAGEQYDEKKQKAANKAGDVRSRVGRL